MCFFLTGVSLILAGGLASILAREERKGFVFALFFGAGSFLALIVSLKSLFLSSSFEYSFDSGFPAGKVTLLCDPLSAFFVSMILIMGFLGIIYGNSYLKSYFNKQHPIASHYVFLGIFFASLILLPVIRNAFFFIIIWEFMSLSSLFLVLFENKKSEVLSAGINYLVTMHISVIFLIAGFAILSFLSGSYDFDSFSRIFESKRYLADALFLILFLGFGIKAGFTPFHFWLPKAHPAAPSHVSGIMSGIMTKIGIYGILRVITLMKNPNIEIAYFILIISLLSALYGILYAIGQHDLKKLLAYSSIENIGIMGLGIGTGMMGLAYNNSLVAFLGFSGAILHILNHSIFKELLFLGAGSVYSKTHTRNIDELGGLAKKMPATAVMFLIGSLAISGLPPFNGFISEFLIYIGLLNLSKINNLNMIIVSVVVIVALALVGTMALLCFTKVFGITFQGEPRSEKAEKIESDADIMMLVPKVILCIFIAFIGLFPNLIIKALSGVVNLFVSTPEFYKSSLQVDKLLNLVSILSFVFIFIIIATVSLRKFLLRKKKISFYKTWDCGYQKPNSKMQYTAHSFAEPFTEIFSNLYDKKDSIKAPNTLFPSNCHYKTKINDILEAYFVNPCLNGIKKLLGKFIWVQNGNTQFYILYGFVFLVIALVGIFFYH